MKEYGGFVHNEQTVRVVTMLEQYYEESPGLNLTWETLEGVAKHKWSHEQGKRTANDRWVMPLVQYRV